MQYIPNSIPMYFTVNTINSLTNKIFILILDLHLNTDSKKIQLLNFLINDRNI